MNREEERADKQQGAGPTEDDEMRLVDAMGPRLACNTGENPCTWKALPRDAPSFGFTALFCLVISDAIAGAITKLCVSPSGA